MGFLSNLFGGGNSKNLKEIIQQGALLVDVREKMEFAEGSVKGAVNIPLGTITSQIEKFKNKNNIIVFCRSGMRSGQAKSILEGYGIKNVFNGGSWYSVANLVK
jgi:rhodanese-related sulfurtransferase